jgi:DUF971 family protein
MTETRPTGITANRDTAQLSIQWSDGHASLYPFTLLRRACPCAECRGGHENMGSQPDPAWFGEIEIHTNPYTLWLWAMHGHEWEDGHHYGIYN